MKAFPNDYEQSDGMDLRDYFAAKALNAIIFDTSVNLSDKAEDFEFDARLAYQYADAMMKAREQ